MVIVASDDGETSGSRDGIAFRDSRSRSETAKDDNAALEDIRLWLLWRMKTSGQKRRFGMTNASGLSAKVENMIAGMRVLYYYYYYYF